MYIIVKDRRCFLVCFAFFCSISPVFLNWRLSSAGRAFASHARGRWFEPSSLHHIVGTSYARSVFLEKISHPLHSSSSSAKNPDCAPKEKTFAPPSLGFFLFACLPLFRGYAPAAHMLDKRIVHFREQTLCRESLRHLSHL